MIAALYVARGGAYYAPELAGQVDPWPEDRDARLYAGPHPALSRAWAAHGIGEPARWGWQRALDGSWICEVSQAAYGHRAEKLTRLLYVGTAPPPPLRWDPAPTGIVSNLANHAVSDLPRLSARETKATPPAFRDALLDLARRSRATEAA